MAIRLSCSSLPGIEESQAAIARFEEKFLDRNTSGGSSSYQNAHRWCTAVRKYASAESSCRISSRLLKKGQRPLADARGSETHLRSCNELPGRDREGAVAATTFSASCWNYALSSVGRRNRGGRPARLDRSHSAPRSQESNWPNDVTQHRCQRQPRSPSHKIAHQSFTQT
jgi:hypothetical protein